MDEISVEKVPEVDFGKVRRIEGYEKIVRNHAPYLSDESRLADEGAELLFFRETRRNSLPSL